MRSEFAELKNEQQVAALILKEHAGFARVRLEGWPHA
jgi:hypothetical protein